MSFKSFWRILIGVSIQRFGMMQQFGMFQQFFAARS
jgi:hypothetical protein